MQKKKNIKEKIIYKQIPRLNIDINIQNYILFIIDFDINIQKRN